MTCIFTYHFVVRSAWNSTTYLNNRTSWLSVTLIIGTTTQYMSARNIDGNIPISDEASRHQGTKASRHHYGLGVAN